MWPIDSRNFDTGRYCFGYRCFTDQGVLARFQSIYESRPGFERFGRRDFGRIDVDFTGYSYFGTFFVYFFKDRQKFTERYDENRIGATS